MMFIAKAQLKARQSQIDFFKPTLLPKNERTNSTLLLWNLRLAFFGSFFRRSWRHQKNISKLTYLQHQQWTTFLSNLLIYKKLAWNNESIRFFSLIVFSKFFVATSKRSFQYELPCSNSKRTWLPIIKAPPLRNLLKSKTFWNDSYFRKISHHSPFF